MNGVATTHDDVADVAGGHGATDRAGIHSEQARGFGDGDPNGNRFSVFPGLQRWFLWH